MAKTTRWVAGKQTPENWEDRITKNVNTMTAEERDLLRACRDKWTDIALSCEPIEPDRARDAALEVYRAFDWYPPTGTHVVGGPTEAKAILEQVAPDPFRIKQESLVRQMVKWLFDEVGALLESFPREVAREIFLTAVVDHRWIIAHKLDAKIYTEAFVRALSQTGEDMLLGGLHEPPEPPDSFHVPSELPLTDFQSCVLGRSWSDRTAAQIELAMVSGVCWMFKSDLILQDRPVEVHWPNAELHREGGPAVKWRDGTLRWFLNDVEVPQWLAEEPAEAIDPKRLLELENSEVRREFVRRVGIDRVCHGLNAECVDKAGDYELLRLDLGDGAPRPFLKMLNPSIGTWHIEGVDPHCRTVAEALAWRDGEEEYVEPDVLT